ncbi:MAG: glycosyltransferase family 2 protein, partial [Geminicoccaceae bacterium]
MTPLISIVIPVYNRADMIGRTVEGCLAQTYPEIEIVLVDDCSTDGLSEALAPFADEPRVHLVRHAENKGVSAARNSGVEAAKGELIAFLDSDDQWLPTKLERQIALISAHDGDRFLCGTLTEVRSNDDRVRFRPKRLKPRDVRIGDYLFVHNIRQRLPLVSCGKTALMEGFFAQTSSYLLPKTLAQATPFRTALNQYEDMAFLID